MMSRETAYGYILVYVIVRMKLNSASMCYTVESLSTASCADADPAPAGHAVTARTPPVL